MNASVKESKEQMMIQSMITQSTQIILDEIQPQPLTQKEDFKHQLRDYNFHKFQETRLRDEEFEEPIQLSDDYWWLPKLEQISKRYREEFNNYSEHYLCNSVWWTNTNPVTYY